MKIPLETERLELYTEAVEYFLVCQHFPQNSSFFLLFFLFFYFLR